MAEKNSDQIEGPRSTDWGVLKWSG